MRLGRIASPDGVAFVSIEGEDGTETAREIAEHPFGTPTFTGRQWPLADVRLLAPILASKVVCMGKNYAAHAAEMGSAPPESPVIFIKPNTSIIGPGLPIQLPPSASEVHHEGELAIVIGRPCKDVPASRAAENILGYTIGNDVSARDHQRADGQWTRAKGHDTFCPLGPWIVTPEEISDPYQLDMRLRVNGELRQQSVSGNMALTLPQVIAHYSPLGYSAGDVLSLGTVAGVAGFREDAQDYYLKPGDVMECEIERIGVLRNPVISWEQAHGVPAPPFQRW